MARTAVEPPLQVEFDVVPFEGFDVLVVTVQELPESAKPCVVRRTGRGYLRSWDGDFELSDLEVQAFLTNRAGPRRDEDLVAGANFGTCPRNSSPSIWRLPVPRTRSSAVSATTLLCSPEPG